MQDNTQLSVKEIIKQNESSKGRKRLSRWIAVLGLLFIVAVVGAVWNPRGSANIMSFRTRPVQFGDLVITVTATGNLEATNQVEVGSELSGIITSMTADYNDTVEADQPLAYLDSSKYEAAVMKSRAEVASARANYKEALATRKADRKTLKRYRKTRELTKGKLPSLEALEQAEAELERSTAAVAAAKAAIDIAEASLKSNEADLKKTVIYSPISGIVLSRDVEPGQTVAASLEAPVLYTLAEDLRHMELQVDVDEADVGLVKEGQSATFTVDAYPDRTFEAQITQVRYGAETTDGVVTYKTVLRVENPELLLRPGMTATANIIVQKVEKTLLVPNTALRFTPQRPEQGKKESRGLLSSLMPGPPHRRESKKNAGEGEPPPGMNGKQPSVWILKDNRPFPVPVQKGATDGVLTAVTSRDIQEGTGVIVNAIRTSN
ncbi:efflux RND transporter periplasmic adaptor subunit [Desulfonema magnum]|nr:efflux RND transporter periplasmic adaptor subunit [Desulfonema magnum]